MRPKNPSNIQIGEIVKMNREIFILLQIFDRPNGQMILYTGNFGDYSPKFTGPNYNLIKIKNN